MAKEMEVDLRWALWRKVEFLKDEIRKLHAKIGDALYADDLYSPLRLAVSNSIATEYLEIMISLTREMKMCEKKIKHLDDKPDPFAITNEMIAQARTYPIERLVEFQKGTALAFCHNDKNPSLTWDRKRNRAKCWPCDKSFDSIAVLVERDGMRFKDAVRELCNRG